MPLDRSTCGPAVQHATTELQIPPAGVKPVTHKTVNFTHNVEKQIISLPNL